MSLLRILIYVVTAIIASATVFAVSHLFRYGWSATTYNGEDPWALFFIGIGGAFVPISIATVIAGITKLAFRSRSVLNEWLVILALATIFFAAPTFYVAATLN